MATTDLIGAQKRAERPTPLSVFRPTAPLPTPAVDALRKLESAFPAALAEQHRIERAACSLRVGESTVINGTPVTAVSLEVAEALTRYEVATARYDELIVRPASSLSPAEFDAVGTAQQTIAESLGVLADAGMLHLIEPAETATRYRQASAHCRHFAACADFDGCLEAQDEMGHCRRQLEQAGRLDLIGGV